MYISFLLLHSLIAVDAPSIIALGIRVIAAITLTYIILAVCIALIVVIYPLRLIVNVRMKWVEF